MTDAQVIITTVPGPATVITESGPRGLPGAAGADTGEEILAKLASVDGHGSGLDADTLDGNHAAAFDAAGAADTAVSTHVVDSDPHTQYHTDTRGDARYSQLGHTHAYDDLTGLPTLGTAAARDVDAFDAAGVASAAVSTHAGVTAGVHGISAFGATLVDDTDAATARATLGLGSAAVEDAGTGAGNLVQLDGAARLPAVDGSRLTNLPSSGGGTTFVRGATFVGAPLALPVNDVPVVIEVACEIVGVTVLTIGDTGSCVIDVWRDSYENYPPTVADSICGGNKPTISSGAKYQDSALSGWATTVAAGDTITFKLESVSGGFTLVAIALTMEPI